MPAPGPVHRTTTEFLPLEEGRIAFDRAGTGPLVLLVPGMGDLRATYRFLVPQLVAAGFTAVTCDLRGHGESSASFTSYGDTDTAGDVAALLEHLGGAGVVVGSSMAAGAAVIVAAERPELVTGLVLLGPFVRDPARTPVVRLALRVLMAPAWIAPVWRAYLPTLYAGRRPADFEEHRARVVAAIRRPGYRRSFSLTTRTSHDAAEAALARVSAPALVVMGEQDPDFTDPGAEARWASAALRGSSVLVPATGHYPHAQDPRRVGDAVLGFLAGAVHRA